MKIIYKVKSEEKLSQILRSEMDFSSRIIRILKKEKSVSVNDIVISYNAVLRVNDIIEVNLPKEENIFNPEDIPVDVAYEDDYFIVVNKQTFMVVHPTKNHPYGTLANGLAYYMESKGDSYKIRFANRLDRDTSGLLIICKFGYAHKLISDQLQSHTIVKEYDAIVEGVLEQDSGTINEPIDRASEDSVHRVVRPDGQQSVTHYEVVKRFEHYTWLRIRLETGRTHQIRVHLKHLGHTLLGDELYGGNHDLIGRQALHACHLNFNDVEGKNVDVWAEMPDDMKSLLE